MLMTIKVRKEISRKVDQLFDGLNAKRGDYCVNPVTGGRFIWGDDPVEPQKETARRALAAQEWFAVNGPPDAPLLPLSHDDMEDYRRARGLKGLVGFYSRSLAIQDYDVLKHPTFDDFCCGLMAIDTGAWGIEKDAQLRKRFPPRQLAGMTSGAYWARAKPMANYKREESHAGFMPSAAEG
jgi:hypothetical protein